MTETPLVSILCTNYNNSEHLPDMVESLFSQAYKNWELVFVDDGSTDESQTVISEYEDARIIKHFLPVNKGAGAAGRIAADIASGEIMGRLDADDALTPDAISVMVDAHLKQPRAALITSQIIACTATLEPSDPPWHSNTPIPPKSCILKHPTVGHFATFKRQAYEKSPGFDTSLQRAVDLDLYLKLEEQGSVITLTNRLYLYRKNANGISQGHNGTLARSLAYQVMVSAYHRRKRVQHPQNLSRAEAKGMSFRQHQIQLHEYNTSPQVVLLLGKTLTLFPELALTPTLWRNTISALIRCKTKTTS